MKYLQKLQEHENFSKEKGQENLGQRKNKTCRIMTKCIEENKMINFFKRKITTSEKVIKKQETVSKILSAMAWYNLKRLRK